MIKSAVKLPRTLSEGQAALSGQGARDARERAILELLFGTGLRASELGKLLSDLDLQAGLVFVHRVRARGSGAMGV